ncbi:MAG TPA: hypothetical protein VGB06_03315, partial [Solirubrobacterales bacterium]
MTRRRSNIFVLVFVLALLIVSGLIVAKKETRLGLDLSGGTELIYQGTPTGKVSEVSSDDIERSIGIIRERVDELGVAEPEVSRLGEDNISVSLPDVTNAQRAIEQVGTTAQLYFYDWEPNLIGREKVIGGFPGSEAPPGLLKEADDEWVAAGRSISKEENVQLILSGAYPTAYAAVKLASEQKPEPDCTECSTNRPRYYLFSGDSAHELIAGPEFAKKDLFVTATGKQRAGKDCDEKTEQCPEVLVVPPGTIVVSELPSSQDG